MKRNIEHPRHKFKTEQILKLNGESFRRYTGFKRNTYEMMLKALENAEKKKHERRGSYSKLSLEDRLLLTMEYWREYRTMFHIGTDFGITKGAVCKIIRWVEDVVSEIPELQLPGKKELKKSEFSCEVFLIDATESPIERPKRSKKKES